MDRIKFRRWMLFAFFGFLMVWSYTMRQPFFTTLSALLFGYICRALEE